MPYWVKLKNDNPFCLVVSHEKIGKIMKQHTTVDPVTRVQKLDYAAYNEALQKYVHKAASQYGVVESVGTLPYAAHPAKSDTGKPVDEWTLCYSPNECCGRTSCPKSRACSE